MSILEAYQERREFRIGSIYRSAVAPVRARSQGYTETGQPLVVHAAIGLFAGHEVKPGDASNFESFLILWLRIAG